MKRLDWRQLRRPSNLLVLLLAVGIGVAVYFALTQPAKAARQALEDNRRDNATLCEFFRTSDHSLQTLFDATPSTATGSKIIAALTDIQAASREVAVSSICPPP